MQEVSKHHSYLDEIISDHEPQFCANFLTAFLINYHPQIEHTNQTLV